MSKWGPSPFENEEEGYIPPSPEPRSGKGFSHSKTVWSGVLVSSLSILSYVQGLDLVANYPAAISIIGVLIGIGMIALRFLTNEPIRTPSVILRPKQVPNMPDSNSDNKGIWNR